MDTAADQSRRIWASGCELAGRLAEAGVRLVTLAAGDERVELHARVSDLPRALHEAPSHARLLWPGGEAVREADGWRVTEG